MSAVLTIISIWGSIASIFGLVYLLLQKPPLPLRLRKLAIVLLAVAGLLSLYVILVPSSFLGQNLRDKLSYYRTTTEAHDRVLVQRGEFRMLEDGPLDQVFTIPFAETPKVEVVNLCGASDDQTPAARATQHKVTFARSSHGGTLRLFGDRFAWIAMGTPLEAVQEQ